MMEHVKWNGMDCNRIVEGVGMCVCVCVCVCA